MYVIACMCMYYLYKQFERIVKWVHLCNKSQLSKIVISKVIITSLIIIKPHCSTRSNSFLHTILLKSKYNYDMYNRTNKISFLIIILIIRKKYLNNYIIDFRCFVYFILYLYFAAFYIFQRTIIRNIIISSKSTYLWPKNKLASIKYLKSFFF